MERGQVIRSRSLVLTALMYVFVPQANIPGNQLYPVSNGDNITSSTSTVEQ